MLEAGAAASSTESKRKGRYCPHLRGASQKSLLGFFFLPSGNTGKRKSTQVDYLGNFLFFDVVATAIKAIIVLMYKQFNTTSIGTYVQIFKPCVHSSLQVFIADKSLSTQPHFEPRKEVVIRGRKVWAVWRMLKSDPAKIGEECHK